jgi:hypothetical protein
MKTYKTKEIRVIDKIYCDTCGNCCTDDNLCSEYAVLEASWGYNSRKDGERSELHICENCFDDIINWINTRRKND